MAIIYIKVNVKRYVVISFVCDTDSFHIPTAVCKCRELNKIASQKSQKTGPSQTHQRCLTALMYYSVLLLGRLGITYLRPLFEESPFAIDKVDARKLLSAGREDLLLKGTCEGFE